MITEFRVSGMSCAACSAHVEHAVLALEGVSRAQVSLLTGSMEVTHTCPVGEICAAVRRAGYTALPVEAGAAPLAPTDRKKGVQGMRRLFAMLLCTLLLFILEIGPMLGLGYPGFFRAIDKPAVPKRDR